MSVWCEKCTYHRMLTVLRLAIPLICILGLGWPGSSSAATAKLQDVVQAGQLVLSTGESTIISVADVTRVAVAEPKIADVAVVGKSEVLVSARSAGDTTLHVWDKSGLTSVSVRVSENTDDLVTELKKRIGLPGVEPWFRQGTVVLEGYVQTPAEKDRATQVAAAFGKVVDLLVLRPLLAEPEKDEAEDSAKLLAEVRALINEPELELRVVNGTLLITGTASSEQMQERARKIGALYYAQVVDVSLVRHAEQGSWPVEVYRVVDKAVVQVDK